MEQNQPDEDGNDHQDTQLLKTESLGNLSTITNLRNSSNSLEVNGAFPTTTNKRAQQDQKEANAFKNDILPLKSQLPSHIQCRSTDQESLAIEHLVSDNEGEFTRTSGLFQNVEKGGVEELPDAELGVALRGSIGLHGGIQDAEDGTNVYLRGGAGRREDKGGDGGKKRGALPRTPGGKHNRGQRGRSRSNAGSERTASHSPPATPGRPTREGHTFAHKPDPSSELARNDEKNDSRYQPLGTLPPQRLVAHPPPRDHNYRQNPLPVGLHYGEDEARGQSPSSGQAPRPRRLSAPERPLHSGGVQVYEPVQNYGQHQPAGQGQAELHPPHFGTSPLTAPAPLNEITEPTDTPNYGEAPSRTSDLPPRNSTTAGHPSPLDSNQHQESMLSPGHPSNGRPGQASRRSGSPEKPRGRKGRKM